MINLLLLSNFYPVISYRRVRKESDAVLYTVWSLVMVRNHLPARLINETTSFFFFFSTPTNACCRIALSPWNKNKSLFRLVPVDSMIAQRFWRLTSTTFSTRIRRKRRRASGFPKADGRMGPRSNSKKIDRTAESGDLLEPIVGQSRPVTAFRTWSCQPRVVRARVAL